MRGDGFLRVLFVLYCLEAGTFLTVVPWTRGWSVLLGRLPSTTLSALLAAPGMRAALCAFGTVHLLWAAHDVVSFLRERRRPEAPANLGSGR